MKKLKKGKLRRLIKAESRGATATVRHAEAFTLYLRTECHLAENTVAAYSRDMRRFVGWLGDRKIADHRPSKLRPRKAQYWHQRGDKTLGIGHVFKYPYGYYDLLRRAKDEQLAAELDSKAYQIF